MDEADELPLNYAYDIDFNFTTQKQQLDILKNKYNLNTKSVASTSSSAISSQQSFDSNRTSQTDSTNDEKESSSQVNTKSKSRRIKEKTSKTSTNKNKSKYENLETIIDSDLLTTYGQQLSDELNVLDVNHKVKSQICSNLITWIYKANDERDLDESECDTVLLILNWKDVINYVSSNSFITHIKMVSETLGNKRISLGLYGFENYFKFWKLQKGSNKPSNNKNYAEYKNSFKINKPELEYMLTELEVRLSCCHRFLENTQDIVNIISQHTKSIAHLSEKLEKYDKYKNIDFYVMKDNRDCVMVDKHGNGLKRLWQQQLTTFEMVRLETAEAIISKYPTPSQLFDAYQNCDTKAEGTKQLEDIPIRRAAGPLTTSRKIGPELSSRVFNFFTATDGNTVL